MSWAAVWCLLQVSKTTKKPIVKDKEQAYVNVVGKYLQAAPHLRSWNHIVRDAQRWL